jgi:S-adenosylmethionine synthetase
MIIHPRHYTVESVTCGHPDKICDHISDALLDELLRQDQHAHAGIECFATTGLIIVGGEIKTTAVLDVQKIVRQTLRKIGYTDASYGIDAEFGGILSTIHEQSPDIDRGVTRKKPSDQGAGDQGLMFGYATNETPEYMPLPITLAHALARRLAEVRKKKVLPYLRPDGKTQVALEYVDGRPLRLASVVVSAQHNEEVSLTKLRHDIVREVVKPVCKKYLDQKTALYINMTGRFVIGGPHGDAGLTGRKIIVDTYGGMGRHGGGCFSGKDPSKVDRSGAYMARYVAKNIVAADLAERVEVQVAYVIGRALPTSIAVNTFGTGSIPDEKIVDCISKVFDFRPAKIAERLQLKRPIYAATSSYGHFGRAEFPWEKVDAMAALKQCARE